MAGNQLMSGLCEPMPGIDTRIVAATSVAVVVVAVAQEF